MLHAHLILLVSEVALHDRSATVLLRIQVIFPLLSVCDASDLP